VCHSRRLFPRVARNSRRLQAAESRMHAASGAALARRMLNARKAMPANYFMAAQRNAGEEESRRGCSSGRGKSSRTVMEDSCECEKDKSCRGGSFLDSRLTGESLPSSAGFFQNFIAAPLCEPPTMARARAAIREGFPALVRAHQDDARSSP